MEFIKQTDSIFLLGEHDERLAEITYPMIEGVPCIQHTYVSESLQGQGIAGKLMETAISDLQQRHLLFRVTCPYARSWLLKHPQAQKLWIQDEI